MKPNNDTLRVVTCSDLPQRPDTQVVYRLMPKNPDSAYYKERTDRNIGWITAEEQEMLKRMTVGIAGCGGMGAAIAERLLRLGVGEIRIADGEAFDISNINRQLAARRDTVGQNKAIVTAQVLRKVTDDSTIVVYPQGICTAFAEHFATGCDVICDEIEFWELAAPIILHQAARSAGVSIFGCNTCGWGTHLFLFTPESMSLEEAFGFTLEEAQEIDGQMHAGTIPEKQRGKIMQMLLKVVVPSMQEYCPNDSRANHDFVLKRLFEEGKASIISTNPALATGFIADRVLLYLLRNSGVCRDIVEVPPMPGYLYLDAAKMQANIVTHKWW